MLQINLLKETIILTNIAKKIIHSQRKHCLKYVYHQVPTEQILSLIHLTGKNVHTDNVDRDR